MYSNLKLSDLDFCLISVYYFISIDKLREMRKIKRKCFYCKRELNFSEMIISSFFSLTLQEQSIQTVENNHDNLGKIKEINKTEEKLFHELSKLWVNKSIHFLCCDCFNVYEMFFCSIKNE
nr:MAG: hypothetical protein [Lokiarchaeota virus Skoll Meg22_1214]